MNESEKTFANNCNEIMFAEVETNRMNENAQTSTTDRRWTLLRCFLAVVILTAAFMKAWQLATTPSLGEGLLHARWFNILVVEFELIFGIWLLFGLLPKLTWVASVGCFTVFTLVSLYKALSGEVSCGCFGAATINPWYTMTFDMAMIGLMILFYPSDTRMRWIEMFREFVGVFRQKRFATVVLVWFLVTVPLTSAMVSVKNSDMSEFGKTFVGVDGKLTITLEPERWASKDFGLADHTDIKNQLHQDVWLVLLHTHACLSCRESVRLYRELAVEFAENKTAPKIAMIELPPYEVEQALTYSGDPVVYGKLDKSHRWKIKSPAVLLVDNRRVQNVFDNPLETDLIRAIWGNKK